HRSQEPGRQEGAGQGAGRSGPQAGRSGPQAPRRGRREEAVRLPPARRAGPILIVAGGVLLSAGAFLPQVIPTGLDRSHWSVSKDSWEPIPDPQPFFPREDTYIYAGTVLYGLAFPIAAGLAIAAGGLLARSRLAAVAALLFHLASFWLLAAQTL